MYARNTNVRPHPDGGMPCRSGNPRAGRLSVAVDSGTVYDVPGFSELSSLPKRSTQSGTRARGSTVAKRWVYTFRLRRLGVGNWYPTGDWSRPTESVDSGRRSQ